MNKKIINLFVLLLVLVFATFVFIRINEESKNEILIAKSGTPHHTIKSLFTLLNAKQFSKAFTLCENSSWKTLTKFRYEAWNDIDGVTIDTIIYKHYSSFYGGDRIIQVAYETNKDDQIRKHEFDFHLKKFDDEWKVVRRIHPENNDSTFEKPHLITLYYRLVDEGIIDSKSIPPQEFTTYISEIGNAEYIYFKMEDKDIIETNDYSIEFFIRWITQ